MTEPQRNPAAYRRAVLPAHQVIGRLRAGGLGVLAVADRWARCPIGRKP